MGRRETINAKIMNREERAKESKRKKGKRE
jgi:hypothetical protein